MGIDTLNLFSLLYDLETQYSSIRGNVCQTTHCAETSTQAEHSRVNVAGICFTGSLHFLALEGLSEPLQPLLSFGGLCYRKAYPVYPRGYVSRELLSEENSGMQ